MPDPFCSAGACPVILDTDMSGDCDDAGALAMLHQLAAAGEAVILACIINGRDVDRASGAAVSAINTYYRRPTIPLAIYHGEHSRPVKSQYTAALRDEFPHSAPPDELLPSGVELYRQTLASAAESSVTIISIGFLTVLHELLTSGPDSHSPLGGRELVRSKVRKLVVMGGEFPESPVGRPEFNFMNAENDGQDAAFVAQHWPTPVLFSGFELGLPIRTGPALASSAADNPVRRAYEQYCLGEGGTALSSGRPSWDQTAILAGVRGPAELWDVIGGGYCEVDADGGNRWQPGGQLEHYYLAPKAPVAEITALIEELMTRVPLA